MSGVTLKIHQSLNDEQGRLVGKFVEQMLQAGCSVAVHGDATPNVNAPKQAPGIIFNLGEGGTIKPRGGG